jgi:riboflavin-specific deaminase-like protein
MGAAAGGGTTRETDAEGGLDADAAWRLLLAVRSHVEQGRAPLRFSRTREGIVLGARGGQPVIVEHDPPRVAAGSASFSLEGRQLLDVFLGLALISASQGSVTAVLGQTLDGYIATHTGDSRYVNGPGGLAHLHRLRALSDAVIVGATTAALDKPRLTTRHVSGPSPVRVVIDPAGRLPATCPLLTDGAGPTLVLGQGTGGEQRLSAHAVRVELPLRGRELAPAAIIGALRARGLTRLLIEGGGDTVSRFLNAGCLDRLHLLVAPFFLGAGRAAIRLPGLERLADAPRPYCRQHLLDGDVLFDLWLNGRN